MTVDRLLAEPPTRMASLSGYVDRPIADLAARFADPRIDGVLSAAIRAALCDRGIALTAVRAENAVWLSSGTVRMTVRWHAIDPDGHSVQGVATISLLVVQSGDDAITELLVSVPVTDDSAAITTAVTRRIIDELSRRL